MSLKKTYEALHEATVKELLKRVRKGTATAACVALLVGGCSRQGDEGRPAPSSSIPREAVERDAVWWARTPGRSWSRVAPTGSMAPLFDSGAVLLTETYTGQPLHVGDIVVFDRGDSPRVVHTVREVGASAVLISGETTNATDGWIPKAKIKARVAGILYTAR